MNGVIRQLMQITCAENNDCFMSLLYYDRKIKGQYLLGNEPFINWVQSYREAAQEKLPAGSGRACLVNFVSIHLLGIEEAASFCLCILKCPSMNY